MEKNIRKKTNDAGKTKIDINASQHEVLEHEVYEDGIRIVGGPFGGGEVDSHGDHRIAMSFAMAALRASAPITIRRCANVATSFPGFADLARGAGLDLEVHASKENA